MFGKRTQMVHGTTKGRPPVTLARDVPPAEPAAIGAGASDKEVNDAATLTFLIAAPSFDTSQVTAALGVTPRRTYKSGEPVVTPTGVVVPGAVRRDDAWSYTWTVMVEPDFDRTWQDVLKRLERGSSIIREIRAINPTTLMLICRSSNILRCGIVIPNSELSRLGALGVDLGLEIFAD
jgi:Domain of unknown function (DUF4279)